MENFSLKIGIHFVDQFIKPVLSRIKGALDDAERKFGGALEASGKAKGVGDNGQVIKKNIKRIVSLFTGGIEFSLLKKGQLCVYY